jgi:hypothetical protein
VECSFIKAVSGVRNRRFIMKIPLVTMSSYYKGLLVTSKRDRVIHARERELLIRIGTMFDFDRRFCETTIDELLSNPYISRAPIVFSVDIVAESFFRDALRLADVDGYIHPLELRWLQVTACANGRSDQWLNRIIQELPSDPNVPFEVQKYF